MALKGASLNIARSIRRIEPMVKPCVYGRSLLFLDTRSQTHSMGAVGHMHTSAHLLDPNARVKMDADGWIINESDSHQPTLEEENAQLRAEVQKLRAMLKKSTERRDAALHWKPFEIAISAIEKEMRTRILNRVCKYGSFSTVQSTLCYHDFLKRRLPESDVARLLEQVVRYTRQRTWPEAMLSVEQITSEFVGAYRVATSSRSHYQSGDSEQAIVDSHTDHLLQLRFAMLNPDGFKRALAFRARFLQQARRFKPELNEHDLDFEAVHYVLEGDWDHARLELDLLREQSAMDLHDIHMAALLSALQAYLKEQVSSEGETEKWQLYGCLYTLASLKANPDKPLSPYLIQEWK